MTHPRWVLALLGSLWLAAAPMPEAAAQSPRGDAHIRQRADTYVRQRAVPSRTLLYPRRVRSDAYVTQPMPPSRALLYPRHAVSSGLDLRQRARPSATLLFPRRAAFRYTRIAALRMTQIPRPFRAPVAQPHPLHISRPCQTRWADGLGCPPQSRPPADPFVEALVGPPTVYTLPVLRALGIPVIPNVPPVVIINPD